jgi:hypothetical protein
MQQGLLYAGHTHQQPILIYSVRTVYRSCMQPLSSECAMDLVKQTDTKDFGFISHKL